MITERLQKLRESMKNKGISAYIIPSADFHQSEYVGDYFKCRQFISGFTGSAGTVVVTLEEAGLWTDGRYFIQAEEQLKDSTIKLSNLTMSIVKLLKMPECVAWARIPKLIWSKLSRFRLCVGMWEYNITPSTIVRFLIRIPFSLTLLKQRFQKNNLVISKLKNG